MATARVRWGAAAVALAILAAIAALLPPRGTPGAEIADLGELRALALHFAGFALLSLCTILALSPGSDRMRRDGTAAAVGRARLVTAVGGLIAYGLLLEILQGLLTTRSFQIQDVVADSTGVLAGVAAARLVVRRSS